VRDQVSHPHKTTDKIIVLYILSFRNTRNKNSEQNVIKHSWNVICS
jgi:hypothetical protein